LTALPAEVPALAALQREFADQGLVLLAVDLDDDLAALDAFREKVGSSSP